MRWIGTIVIFAVSWYSVLIEAAKHPFSVHDMVSMERISEPSVSPNGKWVVFVRKVWDEKANKSTASLWLVSTDTAKMRALTSVKFKSDSSPLWTPDCRAILFLSNRSGSQQIWSIDVATGKTQRLSDFPVDVGNMRLSKDGSKIAFSAEVFVDADFNDNKKRDKADEENPVKAKVFEKLMIRHWDEWTKKRNHVFTVSLKQLATPVDLMMGVNADVPTRPFGGAEEFDWSPDGSEIAYTVHAGDDMPWSTDHNIYVVSSKGGPATCMTCDNKAMDTQPLYSPDGKTIAYLAMERPGFEADRLQIRLYDRATKTSRALTHKWDRSIGSLKWAKDGKSLFVTAEDHARQKIYRVDVISGEVQPLVETHYNASVSVSDDRIVYLQDSFLSPAEVWTARSDGSNQTQLTHVNDLRMSHITLSEAEEFVFDGAGSDKVQAWILKPIQFKPGMKYPLAFIVHGGPQGAVLDHFSYRWNPQAFTGAGYGVVVVNFHGSSGFGQAFTDSVSKDWGGKPYEDLILGLDYATSKYEWIDKDRVCALGASFGGWMINWINGNTDRFKCLVNHDGIFSMESLYYSTEELWFPEWEMNGTPWEAPKLYEKFSPARFVDRWKTPTLVIHGGRDFRIPDSEGISTFTALQRRGIASKLLYFPEENHWVLRPKNSILWHDTVLDWLNQWLR